MQQEVMATLRAARKLISNPARWTQGRELLFKGARDATGTHCAVADPGAVAWCAQGAIARFAENESVYDTAIRALDVGHRRAYGLRGGPTTTWFNDHRSHAGVLEMFNAAIESEEPLDRQRRRLRGDYSLRQLLDMKTEREAFLAKYIGDAD